MFAEGVVVGKVPSLHQRSCSAVGIVGWHAQQLLQQQAHMGRAWDWHVQVNAGGAGPLAKQLVFASSTADQ